MSRTQQAPMNAGSASGVQVASPLSQDNSTIRVSGTLRLRGDNGTRNNGEDLTTTRHIRWSEDVVDNEGMGKKSSKVCCIYHKDRPVGESSSESDDTDSSSDDCSDCDSDTRIPTHKGDQGGEASSRCSPSRLAERKCGTSCSKRHSKQRSRRHMSPNAYEKMPKFKGQPGKR
ncbi:PPP1R11/YPI1 family protein [Aspergillus clavatus NRRL 1]|uniref:Type 1 phosphatases regulator ypi1 n=1 Tax=Aspergillus clavatus (strain ATCC 1007 / CBS 513.65 / DSM 816 / NCTC 3887 / NRRL 1 / QM 1276 / 107) TaxID=344612 RepID=YPI1_ASPCL|nr:uncharacterized protein ACLA_026790 [Aspergillus clavatus NRRL 1]A1CQN6.1 RecName: Full=Type 1 phosphatases regulator ypi1 [Aspergillus clavatus NRRL 1]EAW07957.1 predicted protein [Aspergillus clavatus NRRL 1]